MVRILPASRRTIPSEPTVASAIVRGTAILAAILACATLPAICMAEALDWNGFATAGAELIIGRAEGGMGFERQQGGIGTLNDFQEDLGLPPSTMTLRLSLSVRPLEHHLLRLYGTIPETYTGEHVLTRELTTKNNIYPVGTLVKSEARYGMFGFGYDLDFLVGPRWFGGLHGDLRYLDTRVRMRNLISGLEDTVSVSEVTPCVGAHVQTRVPVLDGRFPGLGVGVFGRMTYGMTPNFLNYYDLSTGVAASMAIAGFPALEAKAAYELEGLTELNISGKDLHVQRAGFLVSLQAAF